MSWKLIDYAFSKLLYGRWWTISICICREGIGLVRIGPVLSDVEETSLNYQPVTQIMHRPIRRTTPCARQRNFIPILLNLEESTFTEKRSESLFRSFPSVQTFQNHLSLWDVTINICLHISHQCQYTCMSARTRYLRRNIILLRWQY